MRHERSPADAPESIPNTRFTMRRPRPKHALETVPETASETIMESVSETPVETPLEPVLETVSKSVLGKTVIENQFLKLQSENQWLKSTI